MRSFCRLSTHAVAILFAAAAMVALSAAGAMAQQCNFADPPRPASAGVAACSAGQEPLTLDNGGGDRESRVQLAQNPGRGYWARWVSGRWASEWTWYDERYLAAYRQPVCGHGSACNCYGRNYCGAYPSGSTAPTWPQGCNRPVVQVRCETRMAAPSRAQPSAACVQNCAYQRQRCGGPASAWAAQCTQEYNACMSRC